MRATRRAECRLAEVRLVAIAFPRRAELVIGKPFYLDEDSLDPEKMPLAKEKIRLALLAVTPGK